MKTNNILVIGDAHVTNDQSLRRFEWLNKFIKSRKSISHIVIMGDFLTLASLSSWDRDKRLFMEGRRFYKEIEAGNRALDILLAGISRDIEIIFVEGNHEDRQSRYVAVHSELAGEPNTIPALLGLASRKIKWIPYKDYITIGGISFTHIPFGKAKEISGKDICSKAELVTTTSIVFGHTHELHTSCVAKRGLNQLQQIRKAGGF